MLEENIHVRSIYFCVVFRLTMFAVTKTVSVEFAWRKDPIICILLYPGPVLEIPPRPFYWNFPGAKPVTIEFSVQKLLSIIDNAKSTDNGKFFGRDGQEVPW